jgi:hypothetical protein
MMLCGLWWRAQTFLSEKYKDEEKKYVRGRIKTGRGSCKFGDRFRRR